MKIFKNFVKEEIPNILLCIAGYGLCALVLMLYGVLDEALIYGGILYLMLITAVFAVRFAKYARRASKRRDYLKAAGRGAGPEYEPATSGERELCERIGELCNECGRLITQLKNVRDDYNDYYTVWVHQIKTPIAAMKMMLEREDTKENRELGAELFRIERYVEMALGYIRLECESNDLVIREYDVDDMVRQAIRKFAPQFVERRLSLDFEPAGLRMSTDEKWFVFILEQLLSNAVKYTKHGGIRIAYECNGDERLLKISDTGIGIAAEDLPRIFEKGYTGFNGREDKKATGLGLYLCRRVCDMLSIGIKAESETGKGSTFSLDLKQRVIRQD